MVISTMAKSVPPELLNRLHNGRVETLLPRIPDESVDCIFADPDYNVGVRYEGRSYTRSFEEYLGFCVGWARECKRILKQDGNFFILNYPKNNAYLRVGYLDSAFAKVYEYVWIYPSNIGHSKRHFTTAHRSILHCTKSGQNRFFKAAVSEPYRNPDDARVRKLIDAGSPGRMPYSWLPRFPRENATWLAANQVKNTSRAKAFHSCQVPESLTETLFRATTKPGDTVLVLFGGAGSELAVCQRLKLNWISAELVPAYRKLIRARLENGGTVPSSSRRIVHRRVSTPKS